MKALKACGLSKSENAMGKSKINTLKKISLEPAKRTRTKEVTGLLHISDRLLAGESSRVEAARGTLQSLSCILLVFV